MSQVKLPTAAEIAGLPRWSRVALAARSARRVLPLYRHGWPNAPAAYSLAVEQAVEAAERAARTASPPDNLSALSAMAKEASDQLAAITNDDETPYGAYAADAALLSLEAIEDLSPGAVVTSSLNSARRAATYFGPDPVQWVERGIAHDFQVLSAHAREGDRVGDGPPPPEALGPLWPDGEPKPWPPSLPEQARQGLQGSNVWDQVRLTLLFYVADGTDEGTVRDKIVQLYLRLNNYSLAKYGKGLEVEDFKQFLLAGVPVEECL